MNALTTEIKTRARLLQKMLESNNAAASKQAIILSRQRNWEMPDHWQLKHCMNLAAADAGFQNWEHARVVLGGQAQPGDDMGDFWHGSGVGAFFNHWFANYAEARAQLESDKHNFLLPYRRQFFVVTADYIQAMGLNAEAEAWQSIGRDLVAGYATEAWLMLAQQRMKNSRTERFNKTWNSSQTQLDLESSEAEAERVMKSFIKDGRLVSIPEQRKKRLVILRWLVAQLKPEQSYAEVEINTFLKQFHEDYATLRREFIINALMQRAEGKYWRL